MRALRAALAARPAETQAAPEILQAPGNDARKLKIELDVIGEAIRQTRDEIVSLQGQGFDSDRIARMRQRAGGRRFRRRTGRPSRS